MTKQELIEFYKTNVPIDKQFLFPVYEPFRNCAIDIVKLLNRANEKTLKSYTDLPIWQTYDELLDGLKEAIIQEYRVSEEELRKHPFFTDEQVMNAPKLIEFDSVSGSFVIKKNTP